VRGQVIYAEGSAGKEMYLLLSGELEITANGERLGFLSDGALGVHSSSQHELLLLPFEESTQWALN
jgi:hypothetical protein